MTVSAVLIVKNEKFLKRCISSFRDHVDEVVIVDTGSDDGTDEIACANSDVFRKYTKCNNKNGQIMDFSEARNYAASLATSDFIFWVDGDDVVLNPESIREETKLAEDGSFVSFDYFCSFDSSGNPDLVNRIFRMHRRDPSYFWRSPIHEYLDSSFPRNRKHSDKVKFSHIQDRSGKTDPDRNLRILETEYAKNPKDPRTLFYLARDSSYQNTNPGRSATLFRVHQNFCSFELEEYQSKVNEGVILLDNGFVYPAIDAFLSASRILPDCYLAYFYLGKCFYILSDSYRLDHWSTSASYFRLCLSSKGEPLFHEPNVQSYLVHTFLNYAYFRLGDLVSAIGSAERGLSQKPDDPNLKMNLSHYHELFVNSGVPR